MTPTDKNIAILRCPCCRGCIKFEPAASFTEPELERALVCISCGRLFPVTSGVPDFMADSLLGEGDAKLADWREKLALQKRWWLEERDKSDRGSKESKHWRPSVEVIGKYMSLRTVNAGQGRVLDIGCADGSRSSHFFGKNYFGIDSVVISGSYGFPFFRSMAEFLPFADGVFDVAVSIESIDHFIDPAKALNEAARVLSSGGAICIFVRDGEKGAGGGCNGSGRAHYPISEEEVHLHRFSEGYFREKLSPVFDRVEILRDNGYLAVFGFSRKGTGARLSPAALEADL